MAIKQVMPVILILKGDGVSTVFNFSLENLPSQDGLNLGSFGAVPTSVSVPMPPYPVTSSTVDANGNVTITFTSALPVGNITVELDVEYASGTTLSSSPIFSQAVSLTSTAISVPVVTAPTATADLRFASVATSAATQVPVNKTTYTEAALNAQRSFTSSSANDAAAGTGAQTITVRYLDQTGAGPFTETITLNGTTAVNTVNTNICFIDLITVTTVGSTGSNVGTITLWTGTGGAGFVICTIAPTDNRTLLCLHYTPTGVTTYFTEVTVGSNSTTAAQGGTYVLQSQKLPIGNNPLNVISGTLVLFGQASNFTRVYTSFPKVVGPARTRLLVTPNTGTSLTYYGALDFFEQ